MATLNLIKGFTEVARAAIPKSNAPITARTKDVHRHAAAIYQLSGDKDALQRHLAVLTRNNKVMSTHMLHAVAHSVTGKPVRDFGRNKGKLVKKDAADHIFNHFYGSKEAASAKRLPPSHVGKVDPAKIEAEKTQVMTEKRWDNSATDAYKDKKIAKQSGVSLVEYEGSPLDEKNDDKQRKTHNKRAEKLLQEYETAAAKKPAAKKAVKKPGRKQAKKTAKAPAKKAEPEKHNAQVVIEALKKRYPKKTYKQIAADLAKRYSMKPPKAHDKASVIRWWAAALARQHGADAKKPKDKAAARAKDDPASRVAAKLMEAFGTDAKAKTALVKALAIEEPDAAFEGER